MWRQAAVAGRFYPAEALSLRASVEAYLNAGACAGGQPKALVVPHAGYLYSGAIAGSAYACLQPYADHIRRVILLGPMHRVWMPVMALSSAPVFLTPLGQVKVDAEAFEQAALLPEVSVSDRAHAEEHSLEVQLPFLQTLLPQFTCLPLLVGEVAPSAVARVLERLWGGRETLIVVSSDLSHYHDYEDAEFLDKATCDAIVAGNFPLTGEQACGCHALNGLLFLAHERKLKIRLLRRGNSGDTLGPRDRVVGYGAFAAYEA